MFSFNYFLRNWPNLLWPFAGVPWWYTLWNDTFISKHNFKSIFVYQLLDNQKTFVLLWTVTRKADKAGRTVIYPTGHEKTFAAWELLIWDNSTYNHTPLKHMFLLKDYFFYIINLSPEENYLHLSTRPALRSCSRKWTDACTPVGSAKIWEAGSSCKTERCYHMIEQLHSLIFQQWTEYTSIQQLAHEVYMSFMNNKKIGDTQSISI